MMRVFTLLLLLLSGLVEVTPACASPQSDYDSYLARADMRMDAFDPMQAISLYNRAIATQRVASRSAAYDDIEGAHAYRKRGDAYHLLGALDSAVLDYWQAIRMNPDNADQYYNLGAIYSDQGAHDSSILCFTKAIRIDPRHVNAYIYRASEYEAIGDFGRSVRDLDEAIGWDTGSDIAHFARAWVNMFRFKGVEAGNDAIRYLRIARASNLANATKSGLIADIGYRLHGYDTYATAALKHAITLVDSSYFGYHLMRYALGKSTLSEMLQLVDLGDDMMIARMYVGIDFVLRGQYQAALPHLYWVLDNGDSNAKEVRLAKIWFSVAERKLNEPPIPVATASATNSDVSEVQAIQDRLRARASSATSTDPATSSSPPANQPNNSSSSASENVNRSTQDGITVYVTRTGRKYHRAGCGTMRNGGSPLALSDARGTYGPCSRCNPPY